MPKVSVITPCYNSEKYIGRTLESICRQSFKDWEHIVVDDGSTDGSQNMIKAFTANDRRIQLLSQPNGGVCKARNNGFKASSKDSQYLLFLDADDCLEPLMLEQLASYLDRHPDVGLARCEYRFIDENDCFVDDQEAKERYVPWGLWVRKLKRDEPDTPFVSVFTLCAVIPSISLIRRSVFELTPAFDETFGHHHEDIDLFLHVALHSKIHFVSQPLVRRRSHPDQNTADSREFREFAFGQQQKLYSKWLSNNGLTENQRAIVRAAWRFRQGRLEPFLAFERSRECLARGEFLRAARYLLGGVRRYLESFFPGLIRYEI